MIQSKSDVLIIGAGLGGLAAGVTLTRSGYSVKILEKHTQVGGCATTFRRKGFHMEVGLHAINGLRNGEPQQQLLKTLGVWDHLEPLELPEFYNLSIPGVLNFNFPTNPKEASGNLKRLFPNEKSSIDRYFADLLTAYKLSKMYTDSNTVGSNAAAFEINSPEYDTLIHWQSTSVGKYLDDLNLSIELKACILGNLGYYGDNPYQLSLLYFLIAQASFVYGGAFYLKGGSQSLSNALRDEFWRLGGELLLKSEVQSLMLSENRVIGCKTKDTQEYYCRYLIANCAIPYLIDNLLPEAFKTKLKNKIKTHNISCSLSSLYLGFKTNLSQSGVKHYSNFFLAPEALKNFNKLQPFLQNLKSFTSQLEWHRYAGCLINYDLLDHELCSDNYSLAVMCSIDYAARWNHTDKSLYKKQKQRYMESMFNWLNIIAPGASNSVFYKEVATPLTIQRYTNNSQGSPYGFEQSTNSSGSNRIGYVSPLAGLFFASAWTRPGGGFTGALIAGKLCGDKVIKLLARSSKKTKI